MVNIYMRNLSNNQWIRGLEIPLEDIERLSSRPLKWLRFVAFAVLGAKGDLFDTPDGNIVHYETVSFADLAESYYLFHDGCYHLVNSSGLADYITSSVSTPRRSTFRRDVAQRDYNRWRSGIVLNFVADVYLAPIFFCYYIRLVISGRRNLYEDQQVYLRNDIEIDSTENGILLRTDLHDGFGRGSSAFLKTPNFALHPADVPRVELGEPPASRTTIQHIEPWEGWFPDAPPSILLDYIYGVAIIRRWATADIRNWLEENHETHFKIANTPSSIPEDDDDVEPGDPTVTDYVLPRTVRRRGIHQTRTEAAQCRAIDNAIAFSMFIKGYPPGTTFDLLLQKQEEEAEMRSRQVAREKVRGWLETSESLPLSHGSDRGVLYEGCVCHSLPETSEEGEVIIIPDVHTQCR
ncbi:hypothetical protein L210DRAFT_3762065 [Boletus edulis BED1]|uniref:HNH nuclease domain-containing protein n=1 Tax=Boletus edulis BED1 TaxID=1328754 RepID=A0AAD4BQZ1_BOLED|nr:hypothetical protein L210DRAFT_3762065 [Boletus edulis BED1]